MPFHVILIIVGFRHAEIPTGVSDIHDLHIWGLSTREVALTVHLVMPDRKLTDAEFHTINKTLKEKFRIDHATLQVESGHPEFACHRTDHCEPHLQ